MTASRKPPPFDPITHATRDQTDETLVAYLRESLGLRAATIKSITGMLGTDGRSHECWQELVARRGRDGGW